MPLGYRIVEAIESLLEEHLHKESRTHELAISHAAREVLQSNFMDESGKVLSKALRSIRTSSKTDQVAKFKAFYPFLEEYFENDVLEIIRNLETATREPDRLLAEARTKLSTVATVLRPLKSKWQQRILEQGLQLETYSRMKDRAAELLETNVLDDDANRLWMRSVYNLFSEFAVHRKTDLDLLYKDYSGGSRSDIRKPVGMVSDSSERIYSRNWSEWVGLYAAEILGGALALERDNSSSRYSSGSQRPIEIRLASGYELGALQRQNLLEPTKLNVEPIDQVRMVTAPSDSEPNFSVTLVSVEDTSAIAEHSWHSKIDIIREMADWIQLISALWNVQEGLVDLTISAEYRGKTSKITLPKKSPAALAKAATRYVEATF